MNATTKPAHHDRIGPGIRTAAFHEAGHAAMALILGARLDRVTVIEKVKKAERKGKHVLLDVESGHAFAVSSSPTTHLLIACAGAAAERIRFHRRADLDGSDLAAIRALLKPAGVRPFLSVAASLLRLHWPGVVALAKALEERGKLTGKAARETFYMGLVPKRTKSAKRRAS